MSPDRRAVVFDLDDTLYPFRHFLRSGFGALARYLEETFGCDPRRTYRILSGASRGPARGREIQVCLAALQLPERLTPHLVSVLTGHQPQLRLPAVSRRTLTALRSARWKVGIITNGPPVPQARKIDALGLAPYVNSVVYATQHGTGAGKPDVAPFAELSRRLAVPASRIVVVGDNEECDVAGAIAAGMHAVRCVAWHNSGEPATRAAAVVDSLSQVPGVAAAILSNVLQRHVA